MEALRWKAKAKGELRRGPARKVPRSEAGGCSVHRPVSAGQAHRAVQELVTRELAPRPGQEGFLTADLLKKGAACLRANGQRSADLYVSAAVRRHLTLHGGSAVSLEEREAIRICRRGRGPPAGKQPVPYPATGGAFSALLQVGIWWLLRVQEVIALSLEDVVVYRAGDRVREMGLWVRRSKTDEEDLGALVVRQCVCGNQSLAHCPGCTLWNHAQGRLLVAQGLGGQAGIEGAPLFHNDCGRGLAVAEVLSAVEQRRGSPSGGSGAHAWPTRLEWLKPPSWPLAGGQAWMYLRGAPIRRASQATQEIARAMREGGEAGHGRAPFDPTRMSGVPGWARRSHPGAPRHHRGTPSPAGLWRTSGAVVHLLRYQVGQQRSGGGLLVQERRKAPKML